MYNVIVMRKEKTKTKGEDYMTAELKVVYRCIPCEKEFNPNEVPEMEEFYEEGNWEHPCPNCKQPLQWGLK